MLFPKKANVRNPIAYTIIASIGRLILLAITRRDWRAAEKLQIAGGVIIASNHLSNFDPMALGHYLHDNGRPPRFLAKSGVFKFPLVGHAIRAAGQIPVHRGTSAAGDSLIEAQAALEAGHAVTIYTEGTLTHDPEYWPMTGATGTARLALQTKRPVVPVGQWGPQFVIPYSGRAFNVFPRKKMMMLTGDPVELADLYDKPIDTALLNDATSRIMRAITNLVAELRNEPAPSELWDRRKPHPSAGSK